MEQDESNRVINRPCDEKITVRVINESLGIDSTFDYCSLRCFTYSITEWHQKGVFNDECNIHIVCQEITKEDVKDD